MAPGGLKLVKHLLMQFSTAVVVKAVATAALVEFGLNYCPPPTHYLKLSTPSGPPMLQRCGATTSMPAQAVSARTTTGTTTATTTMLTMTGSTAFSVTMIAECCGRKDSTTTVMAFTSVNYLYQWPTTTTRASTTLDAGAPTRTATTTTTTTATFMTTNLDTNVTNTTNATGTLTATTTAPTTTSSTTKTMSTLSYTMTTTPDLNTGKNTSTMTTTSTITLTRSITVTSTTITTITTTDSSTSSTSTTTSTTTSTMTTTTTSSTTTTISTTSTTTTTVTTSETATTTSTSTTSVTTTTTTTSPKLYPCRPRCLRFPVTGCEDPLSPREHCNASKLNTHCVDPAPVTFRCPIWNVDPEHRPDIEGDYRILCEVCGVAPLQLVDLDARRGHLLLDVQFGPNLFKGRVLEQGISGYAVFLADMHGHRFSEQPTVVVKRNQAIVETSYCCRDTAYTARVATPFPSGVDQVLLEIVPITSVGPLPAGRLTSMVVDRGLLPATMASACHQAVQDSLLTLLVLAAACATLAGTPS